MKWFQEEDGTFGDHPTFNECVRFVFISAIGFFFHKGAIRNVTCWPDLLLQRFDKTMEKREASVVITFLMLQ